MATLVTTDSSPSSLLSTLPGWDTLTRRDQQFIEKETRAIGNSLIDYGRSRLAIGEHLTNIKERCPRGMFAKYIKTYHFKKSVAYENIKAYARSTSHPLMTGPILREAMARNMQMLGADEESPLGVYTKPVAMMKVPPPTDDDKVKINEWLDGVETIKIRLDGRSKRMKEIDADPEETAKKCYRAIITFIRRLPSTGDNRKDKRDQISFAENVFGMVFADLGMSSGKLIEPQAAPDEYRAVVGRPRKEEAAA